MLTSVCGMFCRLVYPSGAGWVQLALYSAPALSPTQLVGACARHRDGRVQCFTPNFGVSPHELMQPNVTDAVCVIAPLDMFEVPADNIPCAQFRSSSRFRSTSAPGSPTRALCSATPAPAAGGACLAFTLPAAVFPVD